MHPAWTHDSPVKMEHDLMDATKIAEYARQLLAAHGDKAEAEAAQKASAAADAGKADEADMWAKVRTAIATMRGPHAS